MLEVRLLTADDHDLGVAPGSSGIETGVKSNGKKRPRLFSPGRLGSPPPELPNHVIDTRGDPFLCKRHFGNSICGKLFAFAHAGTSGETGPICFTHRD
jgi:hypothetical protein